MLRLCTITAIAMFAVSPSTAFSVGSYASRATGSPIVSLAAARNHTPNVGRAAIVRRGSDEAAPYRSETTYGHYGSAIYRACMARHGEHE
jgi:hypothetical protein